MFRFRTTKTKKFRQELMQTEFRTIYKIDSRQIEKQGLKDAFKVETEIQNVTM